MDRDAHMPGYGETARPRAIWLDVLALLHLGGNLVLVGWIFGVIFDSAEDWGWVPWLGLPGRRGSKGVTPSPPRWPARSSGSSRPHPRRAPDPPAS